MFGDLMVGQGFAAFGLKIEGPPPPHTGVLPLPCFENQCQLQILIRMNDITLSGKRNWKCQLPGSADMDMSGKAPPNKGEV